MKRGKFKMRMMFPLFFIAAILVFGVIVMALWNAILPAVIGVKVITYLQALGILLLSKILFGGFGKRGGWQGGSRDQWRNNLREKFATMTPEEKEKFKGEWKNRCGNRWSMDQPNTSGAMAE